MTDIGMAKIEQTDAEIEATLTVHREERRNATGVHYPQGLHQQPIFWQCERPATEAVVRNPSLFRCIMGDPKTTFKPL